MVQSSPPWDGICAEYACTSFRSASCPSVGTEAHKRRAPGRDAAFVVPFVVLVVVEGVVLFSITKWVRACRWVRRMVQHRTRNRRRWNNLIFIYDIHYNCRVNRCKPVYPIIAPETYRIAIRYFHNIPENSKIIFRYFQSTLPTYRTLTKVNTVRCLPKPSKIYVNFWVVQYCII